MVLAFDARVAAFGLAAALVVGILFGLVPAWQATEQVARCRRWPPRAATATGGGRFRSVLVAGEVAAAVLLLCGAGLLLRTLLVLVSVDTGYRADAPGCSRWISASIRARHARPTPKRCMQFYADVGRDVEARPEVRKRRVVEQPAVRHDRSSGFRSVDVVGDAPVAGQPPGADFAVADDGYFRTLDLPIVAGRGFTDRDAAGAPPSASSTKRSSGACSGRNPFGVRIALQRTPQMTPTVKEIVGVARQTHGWATDRESSCRSTCRCTVRDRRRVHGRARVAGPAER